ncbi:hypothetical protein NTCA1_44290 [Novosphingobium sp. TCA1]|nr:hypothetical protein NTCA1_44290 [Novosphingobium sp. TCA1]
MVENRVLHPFKVAGVVHMAHEIDVCGIDANAEVVGNRCCHAVTLAEPLRGQQTNLMNAGKPGYVPKRDRTRLLRAI